MHNWKELVREIDDELHDDYVMETVRKMRLTKAPTDSLINELHDQKMAVFYKKMNEKYILIKRGDAERVVFVEGAIPPEGVLTCDIQPVDPDADDFLTDPYPNNA